MNKKAIYDDISEVIKEQVDNFDITNRFKSSKPCIIEDNYNKSDDIIEERLSINAIENMCRELGYYNRGIHVKQTNPLEMCYAEIPGTIRRGTKHDIIIADDISLAKMKEPDISQLQLDYPKLDKIKENHPHGWYRKFEKKRF